MPLALSLFPDLDGLDDLIEESSLFLTVWLLSIALVLAFIVVHAGLDRYRQRSPIEKMLRKRAG